LANKIYEIDPNYDKNLTENKFLVNYNFAQYDEDNNAFPLVNNDGHLIALDEDGTERLINEQGRYIAYHEDGSEYFVNLDGEEINEDGDKVVQFSPFLDDEGKDVPVPESQKKEEETTKKDTKSKGARASKKKVESS